MSSSSDSSYDDVSSENGSFMQNEPSANVTHEPLHMPVQVSSCKQQEAVHGEENAENDVLKDSSVFQASVRREIANIFQKSDTDDWVSKRNRKASKKSSSSRQSGNNDDSLSFDLYEEDNDASSQKSKTKGKGKAQNKETFKTVKKIGKQPKKEKSTKARKGSEKLRREQENEKRTNQSKKKSKLPEEKLDSTVVDEQRRIFGERLERIRESKNVYEEHDGMAKQGYGDAVKGGNSGSGSDSDGNSFASRGNRSNGSRKNDGFSSDSLGDSSDQGSNKRRKYGSNSDSSSSSGSGSVRSHKSGSSRASKSSKSSKSEIMYIPVEIPNPPAESENEEESDEEDPFTTKQKDWRKVMNAKCFAINLQCLDDKSRCCMKLCHKYLFDDKTHKEVDEEFKRINEGAPREVDYVGTWIPTKFAEAVQKNIKHQINRIYMVHLHPPGKNECFMKMFVEFDRRVRCNMGTFGLILGEEEEALVGPMVKVGKGFGIARYTNENSIHRYFGWEYDAEEDEWLTIKPKEDFNQQFLMCRTKRQLTELIIRTKNKKAIFEIEKLFKHQEIMNRERDAIIAEDNPPAKYIYTMPPWLAERIPGLRQEMQAKEMQFNKMCQELRRNNLRVTRESLKDLRRNTDFDHDILACLDSLEDTEHHLKTLLLIQGWIDEQNADTPKDRRRALVLFSEDRGAGKSRTALSLFGNYDGELTGILYARENFNPKRIRMAAAQNIRGALLDDFKFDRNKKEQTKALFSCQSTSLNDKYCNEDYAGGVPTIITTNNLQYWIEWTESEEYKYDAIFVNIGHFLGPKESNNRENKQLIMAEKPSAKDKYDEERERFRFMQERKKNWGYGAFEGSSYGDKEQMAPGITMRKSTYQQAQDCGIVRDPDESSSDDDNDENESMGSGKRMNLGKAY